MNKQDFEELKAKFEKETKRKKIVGLFFSYFSTAIAVIALTTIVTRFFTDTDKYQAFAVPPTSKVEILQSKIKKLDLEVAYYKNLSDSLIKSSNSKKTNENIKLLDLESKVENLNNIILDNPEKAISIPLLKNEMQHLKDQNEKDSRALKEEIARAYDTNKWIIGLVCTMLVSIIALNISNLLAKSKKE